MIEFKTPIGTLQVKSSYSEMTVKELDTIVESANDPIEAFHVLTGMEKSKLRILDLDSIVPFLEFLQKPPLESVEPCEILRFSEDEVYHLPDIDFKEWGQKMKACELMSQGKYYSMLSVYLQPIIDGSEFDADTFEQKNKRYNDLNADSVWSAIRYMSDQLNAALKKEDKILQIKPTAEQIAAGIKNFNQLEEFNSIRMVAKGKPWRYEEVTRLPYSLVFLELLHNKISATFERKYAEIISKKSKKP